MPTVISTIQCSHAFIRPLDRADGDFGCSAAGHVFTTHYSNYTRRCTDATFVRTNLPAQGSSLRPGVVEPSSLYSRRPVERCREVASRRPPTHYFPPSSPRLHSLAAPFIVSLRSDQLGIAVRREPVLWIPALAFVDYFLQPSRGLP